MAHRAASISTSVALGETSANAVKATAWGWAGPLVTLRVQLSNSILLCRAPDEKAVSNIFKVFGMTRPGLNLRPTGCKADALPLDHHICDNFIHLCKSFHYGNGFIRSASIFLYSKVLIRTINGRLVNAQKPVIKCYIYRKENCRLSPKYSLLFHFSGSPKHMFCVKLDIQRQLISYWPGRSLERRNCNFVILQVQ